MSEVKVMCLKSKPCDLYGNKAKCSMRDANMQCRYYTKVGAFEESGNSAADEWREKYEALLATLPTAGNRIEAGQIVVTMPETNPDEVAIKPHKRHKGQRKDWVVDRLYAEPPAQPGNGNQGTVT